MNNKNKVIDIVKGVFLSYLITFTLIIVYSAILAYTDLAESTIPIVMFIISMFSVFVTTSISAIKLKENGLKVGGLIGFLYVILIYIIGGITSYGFSLTGYSIATIIFNILIGMIGGIIGVNVAK